MIRRLATHASAPLAAITVLLATTGLASAAPFSRADTNRDGLVTYAEVAYVMPKLKEVSFIRFDTNKDGFIELGEWSGLDAFYNSTYRMRN